jgi:hypothetical protein
MDQIITDTENNIIIAIQSRNIELIKSILNNNEMKYHNNMLDYAIFTENKIIIELIIDYINREKFISKSNPNTLNYAINFINDKILFQKILDLNLIANSDSFDELVYIQNMEIIELVCEKYKTDNEFLRGVNNFSLNTAIRRKDLNLIKYIISTFIDMLIDYDNIKCSLIDIKIFDYLLILLKDKDIKNIDLNVINILIKNKFKNDNDIYEFYDIIIKHHNDKTQSCNDINEYKYISEFDISYINSKILNDIIMKKNICIINKLILSNYNDVNITNFKTAILTLNNVIIESIYILMIKNNIYIDYDTFSNYFTLRMNLIYFDMIFNFKTLDFFNDSEYKLLQFIVNEYNLYVLDKDIDLDTDKDIDIDKNKDDIDCFTLKPIKYLPMNKYLCFNKQYYSFETIIKLIINGILNIDNYNTFLSSIDIVTRTQYKNLSLNSEILVKFYNDILNYYKYYKFIHKFI